jgi:colanic acid/amylovoran biosynthesis protein
MDDSNMKIYFAGQDNFGNRGCEALIRGSVRTISEAYPGAEFLVPSKRPDLDAGQWAGAAALGVKFVGTEPLPAKVKWWGRLRRRFPYFERFEPRYQVTADTAALIAACDALIMTGGDIVSLDYGLESLYYWMGICRSAMDQGVPAVLWAGSVGPFTAVPAVEGIMTALLKRFDLITVRESATLKYLQSLGIKGVVQVTDLAFAMEPAKAMRSPVPFEDSGRPVLGFNVSPLIAKFRGSPDLKASLQSEVIDFLDVVMREHHHRVLLVPHVAPLAGGSDNSDHAYMAELLQALRVRGWGAADIELLQGTPNAAELKRVLGRCAKFMGARTHATIGALSQCVPTTSIAYSVKAKGINQDLFGHLDYVLETPQLSRATLLQHFELLDTQTASIRAYLEQKIPVWRAGAQGSANELKALIERRAALVGA